MINSIDLIFRFDISNATLGREFINALKPREYKLKNGTRIHYGLNYEEVRDVIKNTLEKEFSGESTNTFAGYIYSAGRTEASFDTNEKEEKTPISVFFVMKDSFIFMVFVKILKMLNFFQKDRDF